MRSWSLQKSPQIKRRAGLSAACGVSHLICHLCCEPPLYSGQERSRSAGRLWRGPLSWHPIHTIIASLQHLCRPPRRGYATQVKSCSQAHVNVIASHTHERSCCCCCCCFRCRCFEPHASAQPPLLPLPSCLAQNPDAVAADKPTPTPIAACHPQLAAAGCCCCCRRRRRRRAWSCAGALAMVMLEMSLQCGCCQAYACCRLPGAATSHLRQTAHCGGCR